MPCVWVHDCDPERVSDGSRLALYQTLSIECPFLSFSGMCICFCSCLFVVFLKLGFVEFFCFCWSFVKVSLIFCPADHVPDWQPRVF